MKDLNLPIFEDPGWEPKILNMDDYFDFVFFNWTHIFIRSKKHDQIRKEESVDVPFKLF